MRPLNIGLSSSWRKTAHQDAWLWTRLYAKDEFAMKEEEEERTFISHSHCLVAVCHCQPFIKLLLTYLLTYLLKGKRSSRILKIVGQCPSSVLTRFPIHHRTPAHHTGASAYPHISSTAAIATRGRTVADPRRLAATACDTISIIDRYGGGSVGG